MKRKNYIITENYDMYDYMSEFDTYSILREFLEAPEGSKQNWGPLINPTMYQKALSEFIKFGEIKTFPTKYIYQWLGIIMKNTAKLIGNTELAGHSQNFDYGALEDSGFTDYVNDIFGWKDINFKNSNAIIVLSISKFIDLIDNQTSIINNLTFKEKKLLDNLKSFLNEDAIHKSGPLKDQYATIVSQDEIDTYDAQLKTKINNDVFDVAEWFVNFVNKKTQRFKVSLNKNGDISVEMFIFDYLDLTGIYNWMIMPDGSDAFSDFGIKPILKILSEYKEESTPEQTIVIINKCLDVYHQRGDLSSIFIRGGSKSLTAISSGKLPESKKPNLKFKLNEAVSDEFSFETLKSLPSFNQRLTYCKEHLGPNIGQGSSRIVFQLTDEICLKLAKNAKGIAQNELEFRNSDDYFIDNLFPKVFDESDSENYLFLVSEYVLPAKKSDFNIVENISFNDFENILTLLRLGRRLTQEENNIYDESDLVRSIYDYAMNYDVPIVELTRIQNYGLVYRDNQATIVLLDSGFNDDIYRQHYSR